MSVHGASPDFMPLTKLNLLDTLHDSLDRITRQGAPAIHLAHRADLAHEENPIVSIPRWYRAAGNSRSWKP